MTDRELLEKAAKAAGWMPNSSWQWSERAGSAGAFRYRVVGEWVEWNPLTDDGDALRLAVRLGLAVVPYPADIAALHNASGRSWAELRGKDTYAATRRAIVRAAAALGEST